ncbi:FAD/NAD(P)-binding domain-containing protein [Phlegmacium glaucopus]|nr:FAD/NAD(P)-binding domain-containing protein [Phlegmacium glaucopus]
MRAAVQHVESTNRDILSCACFPRKPRSLLSVQVLLGLQLPFSLFNNGCKDIVIVDAVERTQDTSRAMVIHAATLEALDFVGCADKLSSNLWDRNSPWMFRMPPRHTKYSYMLLLPQSKTEAVLEEHLKGLGIEVQRPYKAIGIQGDIDEFGNTQVLFESGEVIAAQYVVGADGAWSAIRQLSCIGFADPDRLPVDDSLAQIVLAGTNLSRNGTIASVHSGSFFAAPLLRSCIYGTDEDIYRVGFNIPANSTVNPAPIHISKVLWSTRFRTHAAIADKFVFRLHDKADSLGGYIFLVGDAAHIHSPAGGQGMNLGIRDAVGLGPALAEHMKIAPGTTRADKQCPPLQVYGEARYKKAVNVIRLTKRIMMVVSAMGKPRIIDFQYWLLRLLGSIPAVKRMVAWQVSGLGNR